MKYKLLFLSFFALSAVSGFHVFTTLNSFVSSNSVPLFFTLMNTVLLVMVWFFSYSSDKEFVRENITLLVAIPAVVLTFGNFLTVALSPGISFPEFLPFMVSSSSLIIFSYLAARAQVKITSGANKEIVV